MASRSAAMGISKNVDPIQNFNLVCCAIGGFVGLFGLVSFLLKEGFFITEPLVSLFAGAAMSPYGFDIIRPHEYAGSQQAINTINLCFTRLVLGIQLTIAGVQLPSKYLKTEWRPLVVLLGPGMLGMWAITSLLAWLVLPGLSLVEALIMGACVTPTDPVLSNSIVKGTFADKHMSKPLQKIIVAESGANDGLGYLFLFLPLFLVKYGGRADGTSEAVKAFLWETCLCNVGVSIAYGAVVGWVAKHMLYWAEKRRLVDKESFHLFVIALALLIIGTVGLIDADDVLACFIAGNTFTWDDWFRLETKDDSLQPIMDYMLNMAVFMWLGAVCPWEKFFSHEVLPSYRLILFGILVLLLRRLPVILAMQKWIPQIRSIRHSLIMGFFGPIGVSAIFYLYVVQNFLREVKLEDPERKTGKLSETTLVAVWFLVVSSVLVHGLAIPLGNLALFSPSVLAFVRSLGRNKDEQRSGRDEIDSERQPLLAAQPAEPFV